MLNLFCHGRVRCSSLDGDSPGTTGGSTWGRQTACPPGSPCTPRGTLACYDASHTAARPTAPAHRQEEVRSLPSTRGNGRRGAKPGAVTHPIVLRQPPGDAVGAPLHSARMIAVFEQEVVLQGSNLWGGRHEKKG